MATEIERKFLVGSTDWREDAYDSRTMEQAYISRANHVSVRIRIVDDTTAWLTVKSGARKLARDEFEYEIPVSDAREMLMLRRGAVIQKTRFRVRHGELTWEIDVFAGENEGLIVAEVELEREDQTFEVPRWVGEEVTGQARYYNASLSEMPFALWSPDASDLQGRNPTETVSKPEIQKLAK